MAYDPNYYQQQPYAPYPPQNKRQYNPSDYTPHVRFIPIPLLRSYLN